MKKHLPWIAPLLFLTLLTPFTPWIDLQVSSLFYTPIEGAKGHFFENGLTHFLFTYGEQIGVGSGALALFIYLLTFFLPKLKSWRRGLVVCGLTLGLGSGVIANLILKEYWGRPRPKEIVQFGGKHTFHPFYHPDLHCRHDPQRSFPSGHVTMGFYYISLCIVAKRYGKSSVMLLGIALTSLLGGGLMITRVMQGGHYVSDVLFSALVMWYVALLADKLVFTWEVFGVLGGPDPRPRGTSPEPAAPQKA